MKIYHIKTGYHSLYKTESIERVEAIIRMLLVDDNKMCKHGYTIEITVEVTEDPEYDGDDQPSR